MTQLLKIYIDLCLFQAKPQDLPFSRGLVVVTGVLAAVTVALSDLSHDAVGTRVAFAAVQVGLFGLVMWAVMRLKGYAERWPQTISAMFGTAALLQLVLWPISRWLNRVHESPDQAAVPALLFYAVGIWVFAIMVSVLRHAVEISLGMSLVICLLAQGVVIALVFFMFGIGAPVSG